MCLRTHFSFVQWRSAGAASPPDFSHGFLLAEYKPIERSDSFLAGIAGEKWNRFRTAVLVQDLCKFLLAEQHAQNCRFPLQRAAQAIIAPTHGSNFWHETDLTPN